MFSSTYVNESLFFASTLLPPSYKRFVLCATLYGSEERSRAKKYRDGEAKGRFFPFNRSFRFDFLDEHSTTKLPPPLVCDFNPRSLKKI